MSDTKKKSFERTEAMIEYIRKVKEVSLVRLAIEFNVLPTTIRRDYLPLILEMAKDIRFGCEYGDKETNYATHGKEDAFTLKETKA